MANIASTFFKIVDDGVASLSSRIYPVSAPQAATRPFVVYELDNEQPHDDLSGHAGLTDASFAVSVWDDTYSGAKAKAVLVRTALVDADISAAIDGITIHRISHDNSSDQKAWSGDGAEFPLYGVEQDYTVVYES